MDDPDRQLTALTELVRTLYGRILRGAYLYGSAVAGEPGPASDLDVFVVVDRPTTENEQAELIQALRPISARAVRPNGWRPVELTIVAQPDVDPWRYPPRTDFQSGEWMRAEFDSGVPQPWMELNPDLAVLIAMVRQASLPLIGPPAIELLPEVPAADVRRAMTDGVDALLTDLETDTTNVLLTLARIWHTLTTNAFASKAEAADWAASRLPADHANVLDRARDVYRGTRSDDWPARDPSVSDTATELVQRIRARS